MSSASDRWIALANKKIIKNGRASLVTITRPVLNAYATSALEATEATPLTFQVYAAPVDYGSKEDNHLSEKPEYSDCKSLKKLYVPGGTTYTPEIGDQVALDRTWRVIAIRKSYETTSVNCAYLLDIGI